MLPIIIGIHGLGNKPDRDTLSQWWEKAILEGLQKKGSTLKRFEFELVYWAHLLHSTPLNPAVKDKNDPTYIEDPYTPSPNHPKKEKDNNFRKRVLDYLGDQLEKISLNEDLTINFSSVNDFVINHFFGDLGVYYNTHHDKEQTASDIDKKSAIREELRKVLLKHQKRRIMLVAHSMGSIIAYDVLKLYANEIKVDTLVTFGCPLGLPVIRGKISAEHSKTNNPRDVLKTPAAVTGNWYNLADLRDKIAVYYQLGEYYQPNETGIGVNDKIVSNDYEYQEEKNPHKSYGYLRTPEMSEAIDQFLSQPPLGWRERIKERTSRFWQKLTSSRQKKGD